MVFNQYHLPLPVGAIGDIWRRVRERVTCLLASKGRRPGLLLNSLQCSGSPMTGSDLVPNTMVPRPGHCDTLPSTYLHGRGKKDARKMKLFVIRIYIF